MAKYHINPATGKPGECKANVQSCRYKLSANEHYASPEEATEAYERQQASNLLPKKVTKPQDLLQELDEHFEDRQAYANLLAKKRWKGHEKEMLEDFAKGTWEIYESGAGKLSDKTMAKLSGYHFAKESLSETERNDIEGPDLPTLDSHKCLVDGTITRSGELKLEELLSAL